MATSPRGQFASDSVRLFRRSCTLDIGTDKSAFRLQSGASLGLTVAFKIEKSDKPEPNKSEIQIFNLTDEHRAQVEVQGIRCLLSAGYPGSEAQIFSGTVRLGLTEKTGATWVTKLEVSDGAAEINSSPINKIWGPGAILKDIVSDLAAELKLDKGNIFKAISNVADRTFTKGFQAHGTAATQLTELLGSAGIDWSVQEGRIQALGPAAYLGDEGPLISPDTGLIGSPTIGAAEHKGGAPVTKFKCLLNPAIRPGQRVQIDSLSLKGVFRCHKVKHAGITRGGEWATEAEVTKQA